MAAENTREGKKVPKFALKKEAPVYTHNALLRGERDEAYNENAHMILYDKVKNVNAFYEYFMKKLFIDDQLATAQDGIYTWLMISSQNVFAIRTRSSQEIGTLHNNLLAYIERLGYPPDPIASGEMWITTLPDGGKEVKFNFQSSVFLEWVLYPALPGAFNIKDRKPVIKSNNSEKAKTNAFQQELSTIVSRRFNEIFKDQNVSIQFKMGEDFLKHMMIRTSPNMINIYNQLFIRNNLKQTQRNRNPIMRYNAPPNNAPPNQLRINSVWAKNHPSRSRKAKKPARITQVKTPYNHPNASKGGRRTRRRS